MARVGTWRLVAGRTAACRLRPLVRLASSSTSAVPHRAPHEDDADDRDLAHLHGSSRPSKPVRQITLALAPPERPDVELPPKQLDDLDRLYEALLEPLPRVPTQQERLEKRRGVVEAEDADAFFALPGQTPLDPESWAHRLRCLGAQGKRDVAWRVFDEMEEMGLAGAGPRPDMGCLHALADASARDADVEGVEEVIIRAKARRLPLNAPYYTSLIGAHRRAGSEDAPSVCLEVLTEARRSGVVEDTPLHTAMICWHLAEGLVDEAWLAYHHARQSGCPPDAVTFTAMMVACAQSDRLEQARNLQMEMRLHRVHPTLATHNAFIAVCAARAASLVELPEEQHAKLRRLGVDLDVQSPVELANAGLQTLIGEGHAPDAHTFLSLLRVAAGAADVPRAQSVITRLLDSDVPPAESHFRMLLRTCVRAQRYQPRSLHENHIRVALSVPPSMAQLGLEVSVEVVDGVLHTLASASRIHRAVGVVDDMYDAYGLEPSAKAFGLLFGMAKRTRRPQLAADLLERMHARGMEPSEEQAALAERLSRPLEVSRHPKLPFVRWSARHGFYQPQLAPETRAKWTVQLPPVKGGAEPSPESEHTYLSRREARAMALEGREAAADRMEEAGRAEAYEEEEEYEEYEEEMEAVPSRAAKRGAMQQRIQEMVKAAFGGVNRGAAPKAEAAEEEYDEKYLVEEYYDGDDEPRHGDARAEKRQQAKVVERALSDLHLEEEEIARSQAKREVARRGKSRNWRR